MSVSNEIGFELDLATVSDLVRLENAEIVIVDEQIARAGRYGEFYFAYCRVDGQLHSLNTYYQQQHLYYWDADSRPDTLTGAFRGEGYSPQELIFLKRYADTGEGYEVAETLFLGPGGDPRVVSNGRDAYATHPVSDGSFNLHVLRDRVTLPITLPLPRSNYGKNWQPFLIGDELFIVHEMEPFRIIKLCTESGRGEVVREIDIDFGLPCLRPIEPRIYPMFRGGSNAVASGGRILGVGRATSIGYRHSPFFWLLDEQGHFEVRFTDFFSEFYKRGFRIIDPTSLFFHDGGLCLGFCATERDWSYTQRVAHFLVMFRGAGKVPSERSLANFLARRSVSESGRGPALDDHLFLCAEMPGATAHDYENAGRVSSGEAGHLVHGPYVEIEEAGLYVAELSYLTLSCPADCAGKFDVTVSRRDESGEAVEYQMLGHADIDPSNREMAEVRVVFDTTGFVGWHLETRVFVEEEVRMSAFHIRTWRCQADDDAERAWAEIAERSCGR